jgi:DNA-binding NarL/FixJ family response regulator
MQPVDSKVSSWVWNCIVTGMIERSVQRQTLPFAYAQEQAEPEPIRIAIADDHPVFRDGLFQVLQLEEGFEMVGRASNGEEVLQLVENLRPEVLLLDLCMPGMDGLAVLRRLRETGANTRVIVLTASEDRERLVEAMQLGASGIVLKQDQTSVLVKSIRRVHAGEIWLHSSTTQTVMQHAEPAPPAPVPERFSETKPHLTRKETEVVRMVAQGLRNREIASRMFISEQTVKNHLRAVFEKLHVGDRLELALYAIHHILEQ